MISLKRGTYVFLSNRKWECNIDISQRMELYFIHLSKIRITDICLNMGWVMGRLLSNPTLPIVIPELIV